VFTSGPSITVNIYMWLCFDHLGAGQHSETLWPNYRKLCQKACKKVSTANSRELDSGSVLLSTCVIAFIMVSTRASNQHLFTKGQGWECVRFHLSLSGIVPDHMCNLMYIQNGVFWDVTPCGSCKNRRFGGTWRLLHQGDKNQWTTNLVFLRSVRRLLVAACVVSS
jgi:hypothetical protein